MPIDIDRATGKVLCDTMFTQEESDKAWAIILEHFLRAHPERIPGIEPVPALAVGR